MRGALTYHARELAHYISVSIVPGVIPIGFLLSYVLIGFAVFNIIHGVSYLLYILMFICAILFASIRMSLYMMRGEMRD